MRYILIDGYSLLFRAYYALPQLRATGVEFSTGAIRGFLTILFKILRQPHTHFAIAFDTAAPTFRHKAYESYKANRPEVPDDFRAQVEVVKEFCKYASIPLLIEPGWEADDLIGTVVERVLSLRGEVVVFTGDRDLLQLLSPGIRVVLFKKGISDTQEWTYERFVTEFGFEPEKYYWWKALVGDPSDNIPGIPGVGPKRASRIVQSSENIEALLNDKHVKDFTDQVIRNLELVKIRRDAKIEEVVALKEGKADIGSILSLLDKYSIGVSQRAKFIRQAVRELFSLRTWVEPFVMEDQDGQQYGVDAHTPRLFASQEELIWLKENMERPPWKVIPPDRWRRLLNQDVLPDPWSYVMPRMALDDLDFSKVALFWHFIRSFGAMLYEEVEASLFNGSGRLVIEENKGLKIVVGDECDVANVALAIFETGGKVYAFEGDAIWADFDDLEKARKWYTAAYGRTAEVTG